MVKADVLLNAKIPEEIVTQQILILQQYKAPLWNITYITSGFNILNVKVNASTGEIVNETLTGLFSLREKLEE